MATFCFFEEDGRRALFNECIARGWVAAMQDFPRLKSRAESEAQGNLTGEALRSEVCCIAADEIGYLQLVRSAYVSAYGGAYRDMSERKIIPYALEVKGLSMEEAMRTIRPNLARESAQAYLAELYAQYRDLSRRS